ncbi:MAG: hypothetical protein AB7H81_20590 [Vicinamibacterales bacterium]
MRLLRLPMMRGAAFAGLIAVGMLTVAPSLRAVPLAPVLEPALVVGPTVTLIWNAVPDATTYRLEAGLAPGGVVLSQNVGGVTSVSMNAPLGTYYVRVYAVDATGESPASNEIVVNVVSLVAPPAAPTNLQSFMNGTTTLFTWDQGSGGGAPDTMLLQAGSMPGGSDIGTFPVGNGVQAVVPNVPPGTYYVRVLASNGAGASAPSNEVQLLMPVGGACSAPPARSLNTLVFSTFVRFSWTPVPGASGYQLSFSETPGGPVTLTLPLGPQSTSYSVFNAPLGTYYGTVTAGFSCGTQATGPETVITIDGLPPPGRQRAPNPSGPTPPNYLPLPNRASVVEEVARQYPGDLRNSCKEHGGNNNFLFRVVERLRQEDTRWGLNWKRANVGDMSQDVVTYNYGSDPDEGTYWVHVVDIIGGHCGNSPSANWQNQTVLFSTGARWTLIPYLDAGFTP